MSEQDIISKIDQLTSIGDKWLAAIKWVVSGIIIITIWGASVQFHLAQLDKVDRDSQDQRVFLMDQINRQHVIDANQDGRIDWHEREIVELKEHRS